MSISDGMNINCIQRYFYTKHEYVAGKVALEKELQSNMSLVNPSFFAPQENKTLPPTPLSSSVSHKMHLQCFFKSFKQDTKCFSSNGNQHKTKPT